MKSPQPQQIVAATMEKDFTAPAENRPAFLYLPGDVIYYNAEFIASRASPRSPAPG